MFTGIVESTGRLIARTLDGDAGKLILEAPPALVEALALGDSLATNGCCLTVEAKDVAASTLQFHTLSQTLRLTNLGATPIGGLVNFERALRLGGRLDGHLVAGHVDGTAPVLAVERRADDWVLRVALPPDLQALVIDKGSIAVNGVSLTVADLGRDWFEVHLIPVTWEVTNLHMLKVGDLVNLEMDMVGKFILRRESLRVDGEPTAQLPGTLV